MGHSKNRARRRLTLPLPLRAKMIGCAMFIGGFMGLITSAQLDPISARVERVIDGDTIQVRFEGKSYTVRLIGVDTPETKHPTKPVQYFGREATSTPGSSATATLMLTGAFPSPSGRSLYDWKNKRGSEESAYGTAARIAALPARTRPTTTASTSGRSRPPFAPNHHASIDRALPGEAQR